MRTRRLLQLLLLGIVLTSRPLLFGQTTTTAPADDSPQETLLQLARATDSGDAAALRELFHAASASERPLLDAIVDWNASRLKFRQAVIDRFGRPQADALDDHQPIDASRVAKATVQITADRAVVQLPDDPEPLNLVRVDGRWRMSLEPMTAGKSAAEIDRQVTQMRTLTMIRNQTSDELRDGRYPSVEELKSAIQSKLAVAMRGDGGKEKQP